MTAAAEPPEGFAERNRERFQRARDACGPDEMVCGTLREDGEPLYFVMPGSATPEEVERRAFEVRNGRPMRPDEVILAREARIRGKLDA